LFLNILLPRTLYPNATPLNPFLFQPFLLSPLPLPTFDFSPFYTPPAFFFFFTLSSLWAFHTRYSPHSYSLALAHSCICLSRYPLSPTTPLPSPSDPSLPSDPCPCTHVFFFGFTRYTPLQFFFSFCRIGLCLLSFSSLLTSSFSVSLQIWGFLKQAEQKKQTIRLDLVHILRSGSLFFFVDLFFKSGSFLDMFFKSFVLVLECVLAF
jgi:hypothetical protein